MNRSAGIYFDGISSVPQKIELILDEQQAELVFVTTGINTNKWAIKEISFEHIGDLLEIRHGSNATSFIKVSDADFITDFIAFLNKKGHVGWYYKMLHLGMKAYISLAVIILGLIVGGYLVVIPWVAEKAVMIIPESYDISMGNTFYKEYVSQNDIDSDKSKALNLFAQQLELSNTRELHFTVVKSSTVNAFALPNGNIIVYTGLIGHEVIHVNNRHSMKMLCRNLAGYIFISVVLSDVNGIMAIIGDNVHNLQSLSYSRQFERQADEEGTGLMIQNNINPKGMTDLFTRLQSEEKVVVPAFISSHPITTDRIEMINKMIRRISYRNINHLELEKLFLEMKK